MNDSRKAKIEALEQRMGALETELENTQDQLDVLRIEEFKEKHKIEVGMRIIQKRHGRGGQVFIIEKFRVKYSSPSIYARLIRKDGTPGTRLSEIYGDWELEKKP